MKNKIFYLSFLSLFFTSILNSQELNIIYTNNLEGTVFPCDCAIEPGGGVEKRLSWYKQSLLQPNKVIYIDAGDTFFQSLSFLEEEKTLMEFGSSIIADSMKLMKIDAFTPGEMDFVLGQNHFDKITNNIPVVITNSDNDNYKKFVFIERSGLKIIILGLASPTLLGSKLKLKDMSKSLSEQIEKHKKNIDLVILLAHTNKAELESILKNNKEVDIVISAHLDEELREPLKINNTIIVRLLKNGDSVGILNYHHKNKTFKKLDINKNSALSAQLEQLKFTASIPNLEKNRLKLINHQIKTVEPLIVNNHDKYNLYSNKMIFLGNNFANKKTYKEHQTISKKILDYKKLQNNVQTPIKDNF